ncbi:MAG: aminotransferase class V-fold PLP-dependent enzyme [Cyclobacteriaceae bacterium]
MNIEQIRKDTPACADKLFFNSAGSSLPPRPVVQKSLAYLQEEEMMGGYRLAELRQAEIQAFYEEAAHLLNTKAANIAFASHATDAYAKALSSVPFRTGDVILTTDDDYVSNYLHFLSLKQRFGIRILRAKNQPNGDLDLDHFRQNIRQHQPRLVAITHIPTNSGLIQDAQAVGEMCREADVLYLLDACQSVGQIEVDVQQIGCDFLSATGRKFLRGPRGSGFLYVSDKVLDQGYAPLFLDLRGANWTDAEAYQLQEDASRFEYWEVPYALLLGLKEALAYANRLGIKSIESYNSSLMLSLREQLSSVSDVRIFDRGSRQAAIFSFRKEGKTIEQTKQYLESQQVFFSLSQKSSAQIDFTKKGIEWAVRLSPHYFNTKDEVDQLVDIICRF